MWPTPWLNGPMPHGYDVFSHGFGAGRVAVGRRLRGAVNDHSIGDDLGPFVALVGHEIKTPFFVQCHADQHPIRNVRIEVLVGEEDLFEGAGRRFEPPHVAGDAEDVEDAARAVAGEARREVRQPGDLAEREAVGRLGQRRESGSVDQGFQVGELGVAFHVAAVGFGLAGRRASGRCPPPRRRPWGRRRRCVFALIGLRSRCRCGPSTHSMTSWSFGVQPLRRQRRRDGLDLLKGVGFVAGRSATKKAAARRRHAAGRDARTW